jgi:salicylate hydroxylase
MIRPPASKIFQSWGLGPNFEAISDTSQATFFRDLKTGKVATRNVAIEIADSPDWGTDRQVAQQLLYDQACRAGAQIEFGSSVEDVYDTAEEATVRIKNGTTYKADLVLAADGIRSRIRPKILADVDESTEPMISEITLYGIRPLVEDLQSFAAAKPLIDSVNLNVWMGKNLQVVGRTSQKLGRFGGLYGIVGDSTDQQGLWDEVSNMHSGHV